MTDPSVAAHRVEAVERTGSPMAGVPRQANPPDGVHAPDSPPSPVVDEQKPVLRPLLETLGLIVAPTTLLTALVFYFGMAYMSAYLRYFALDATVLELTTRDYILRSVDGLFVLFGVLLILGLAATAGHTAVLRALASGRHVRFLNVAAMFLEVLGVALLIGGAAAFVPAAQVRTHPLGTPTSLAAGCALTAYGTWLYQRLRVGSSFFQARVATFARTLVGLLVVLNLFWLTANSATMVGSQRAREVVRSLSERPAITVYSAKRLQVDPGVKEIRIVGTDSAYSYRYEGLRLLMRAGGQYVLLSEGWTRQNGVTMLLPANSEGLRFEFRP